MPKTIDVPSNLRGFNTIFEKIAYRHGYAEVFRDFIDFTTACFLLEGDKQCAELLQRKYDKEYSIFGELFAEWLHIQKRELEKTGPFEEVKWYDTLGAFYEIVSTGSKVSWLGQFFTPPDLVTMMTLLTGGETGGKKRIQDCCSGSGRMLIAYHAYFPGNYTFGADIDAICTKMTAINMALHGCEGEAVCMNSLQPEDWRFGYRVNPYIRMLGGIPHLVPITKEQSFQYEHWDKRRQPTPTTEKREETSISEPKVGRNGQLSFF